MFPRNWNVMLINIQCKKKRKTIVKIKCIRKKFGIAENDSVEWMSISDIEKKSVKGEKFETFLEQSNYLYKQCCNAMFINNVAKQCF